MSTTAIFRKVTSTRYIFLLSGLVFVLWSLAIAVVPKSSILSLLFQTDLDQSTSESTAKHATNASQSSVSAPNSLDVRPNTGIGIPHAHIYVISLAGRQDRREQMEFLRTIQALTWTVLDAVPPDATLVNRVLDRVSLQRVEGGSGFSWPEEINALSVLHAMPLGRSGADTWIEMTPPSEIKTSKSDSMTSPKLSCAVEDDTVPTLTNNTPEWMILSPAKIACWHSHISAIRRFVDGRDTGSGHRENDVAVILEDDIDMEKDISTQLAQVWTSLPAGWDIVFLGHCWSNESHYPALTGFADTNVHASYYPKCTHGYALSLSGARRLLQHLRHPPFAYSRALDQAYAWLVRSGHLRSYSIVPSLVVQRKRGHSDISAGSGSEWRERLRDGVFGPTG